jgi:hypothetical protein
VSARIVVSLRPADTPAMVNLSIAADVSGSEPLTKDEVITVLEVAVAGLRDGSIIQTSIQTGPQRG